MCLDEQIINSYLDGELKEPWNSQVEAHLEACPACRQIYEKYSNLSKLLVSETLDDKTIESSKARVLEYVENNKGKKTKFIRRQLTLNLPIMVTAAAAFVVVFVGAFFFIGNSSTTSLENIPSIELNQNAALVPVSDSKAVVKDLSTYKLEEILKELDDRGFNVKLEVKEISPADISEITSIGE